MFGPSKSTIWRLGLGLALAVLGPACAPRSGRAADPAEVARSEASRRLAGTWILMSFQSEVPLEPMFAGLLSAQFGTMQVQFDGQQMVATGPGVSTTRRYQVTQASDDRLSVVTFDDRGISYDAVGEFRGEELYFASLSTPWRGRGVLRRAR